MSQPTSTPTADRTLRRVASYRIQLRNGLTLDHLAESSALADLTALGVSHIHLSPVLAAMPGSTHGYDVVDHSRVDPALGGDEALERLRTAAAAHGLGLVVDIVPNHMAADPVHNRWWWDVLEHGRSSRHATFFDIDWDGPEERLRGLILLPVLPDHLGREIDAHAFRLRREGGAILVEHPSAITPLEPRSSAAIVAEAAGRPGGAGLSGAAALLGALPAFDSLDAGNISHRRDGVETAASALADAAAAPRCAKALDTALAEVAADPDRLDALLMSQPYRLVRWQSGLRDLAYRRFFDINGLVALQTGRAEVFDATHETIRGWVERGVIDGLRVDHPDGLREPCHYLDRLRRVDPSGWIVVEKILEPGEALPHWPVDGTTGYEIGELISRLHIDDGGRATMTALAAAVTEHLDVDAEVVAATRQVLGEILGADMNRLTAALLRICERHRRFRDFHRHELHGCLTELLAHFGVYRLYTEAASEATATEIAVVEAAVAGALESRPDLDPELFEFVTRLLCAGSITDEAEVDFRLRFHQLSGPAKAKGKEDTAWYRIITSLHRTEVGADADAWGLELAEFHDEMLRRQAQCPAAMTALTTHDSKRSEDVRARLAVLTEQPEQWAAAVERWRDHLARPEAVTAPDPAVEYYLLQTLVGAHPLDDGRARTHLLKAVREAKLLTSWLDPDEAYESHLDLYLDEVLGDQWLLDDIDRFVTSIQRAGRMVSLSQKALQLMLPGIPDLYQETERWNLRLVDPDNRHPMDLGTFHEAVSNATFAPLDPCFDPGIDEWGLTKTVLVRTLLELRRRHPDAFGADGTYEPLWASGPKADHAIVFGRGDDVVIVAARHVTRILDGWDSTTLALPPGSWRDVSLGETRHGELDLDVLLGGRAAMALEREVS